MFGSVALKPYIGLKTNDMIYIVILCIFNINFSIYYVIEASRLEKVFKLEDKHVVRFGKRIGIVSIFYLIHSFFFTSLFLIDLHDLEIMMVFLIFCMEFLLLGTVFKEVYDLLFLDEEERKFELDRDRKMYIKGEEKDLYDL